MEITSFSIDTILYNLYHSVELRKVTMQQHALLIVNFSGVRSWIIAVVMADSL